MSEKSQEGLMDYLNNSNKYTSEAIAAAADELKRRGRIFSEEELKDIGVRIKTNAHAEQDQDGLFTSNSWKTQVVTDPTAPLLYSKGAIRAFSLVFSPIFGAVLLSYNVQRREKKWIVIAFGAVYTIMSGAIVNLIPPNTFYVLLLNIGGGLALTTTFWNMYVGRETIYRARSFWKPLIISIIITIPLVLAMIYG
jgi:hypothetical protein